jgi:acyl-coenzyme A thioesterase PaaI-like protein
MFKEGLAVLINKAAQSRWALWKLNRVLYYAMPFNRKHRIHIKDIKAHSITTIAPYKYYNFNHLKGMHACVIATVAEYCAGLTLLRNFDFKYYRLILAELNIEYHYQAKSDITATAELLAEQKEILTEKLNIENEAYMKLQVEVHDAQMEHVATVHTKWQLKIWEKTHQAL